MFALEELSDENYKELSKLKISERQKEFVLDFEGCVSYKKENPFLKVFGIKKDKEFIGLTAFARWDSDEKIPINLRWTWFDEFFLDEKYQGKGYSTDIVKMILQKIREIYNPRFVVLSVKNDNHTAKHLYEKVGFKYTDLVYDGDLDEVFRKKEFSQKDEIIMTYSFSGEKTAFDGIYS